MIILKQIAMIKINQAKNFKLFWFYFCWLLVNITWRFAVSTPSEIRNFFRYNLFMNDATKVASENIIGPELFMFGMGSDTERY